MTTPERSGPRGLPVYVVLDTSSSMKPHEGLLNGTLSEIYATLVTTPAVMDFVHLSIIAFNSEPALILGMTELDPTHSRGLPQVRCDGSTSYAPMFTLVRQRIDSDVSTLAADGINVLRPVVFFLTDGAPTDRMEDWTAAHGDLIDRAWRRHPYIIAYMFGSAPHGEAILQGIATLALFVAENPEDSRGALSSALNSVIHSMVSSAAKRQLQIPAEVAGYRSVPIHYVDE